MRNPLNWFKQGGNKGKDEGDNRKFTHSGPKIAAAAVAAVGGLAALDVVTHRDAPRATSNERVLGSHVAGKALYEFFAEVRKKPPSEGYNEQIASSLKDAALAEFLEQRPGLAEFIQEMYRDYPGINHGEVIVTGTRDHSSPSISSTTEFSVVVNKGGEHRVDLFRLRANERGEFEVVDPVDNLAEFFPGVARARK
ncbi:MAG: hypothetical protein WBK28_03350 [Minisyncoccia bacterium]